VTSETETPAVEYEEGTDVVVVSDVFTPTVRSGVVVEDTGRGVLVKFSSTPYIESGYESQCVLCGRQQVISEDADQTELAARMETYEE